MKQTIKILMASEADIESGYYPDKDGNPIDRAAFLKSKRPNLNLINGGINEKISKPAMD